ncbi:Protein CNPPD1 [Anthophora plagiata]
MTDISKKRKTPSKLKSMGSHAEFLNRISKSLYYSKLPMTDCLSLPVTELAAELFNEIESGRTLERLDVEQASRISKNACVSPCFLVLALLYLERLKDCNPEYIQQVAPSDLFLVSLMVASKFLNDEEEEDESFNIKWAQSGDLAVSQINQLEKDFLKAINWRVFVHDQDFWKRLQKLEKAVAYKEVQKRGVVTLFGSALVASCLPGTIFSPRQTTNCTDVMQTDLNPVMDVASSPIEILPDNILTTDFISSSLSCNQSQENCESIKQNEVTNDRQNYTWQTTKLNTRIY